MASAIPTTAPYSRRRLATVATCSLNQWAMDFDGNLARIVASIEEAKRRGARYRVGPELEICGYGCEDHFLELDTFAHALEALAALLRTGATDGILCDVGLPVLHRDVRYNCRALVLGRRLLCLRPKMVLAGDGNYREQRWFAAWQHPGAAERWAIPPDSDLARALAPGHARSVPFGDVRVSLRDTGGVACETCEELWSPRSPHVALGLAGVEVIGNGSGSHHQLRKLDARVGLVRAATAKHGGVYLYANQMGCDGGRLLYDGCALIAVNGRVVAQGAQFALGVEVEVVTATVDLDTVRSFRGAKQSRGVQAAREPVYAGAGAGAGAGGACPTVVEVPDFGLCAAAAAAPARETPPLPRGVAFHRPEEEIAYGPACWLWDYLRRSGASGFFLPLSGGADSSSTAAIVGCMCQLVVHACARGDAGVARDARRVCGEPEPAAGSGDAGWVPATPQELADRLFYSAYMSTSNSSSDTRHVSLKNILRLLLSPIVHHYLCSCCAMTT